MFALKRKITFFENKPECEGGEEKWRSRELIYSFGGALTPSVGSSIWEDGQDNMVAGGLPHIIIFRTLRIHITIVFISINMRGCSGQYMLVWSLHINGNKMLPNANDWGSTVVCWTALCGISEEWASNLNSLALFTAWIAILQLISRHFIGTLYFPKYEILPTGRQTLVIFESIQNDQLR